MAYLRFITRTLQQSSNLPSKCKLIGFFNAVVHRILHTLTLNPYLCSLILQTFACLLLFVAGMILTRMALSLLKMCEWFFRMCPQKIAWRGMLPAKASSHSMVEACKFEATIFYHIIAYDYYCKNSWWKSDNSPFLFLFSTVRFSKIDWKTKRRSKICWTKSLALSSRSISSNSNGSTRSRHLTCFCLSWFSYRTRFPALRTSIGTKKSFKSSSARKSNYQFVMIKAKKSKLHQDQVLAVLSQELQVLV